MYLSILKEAYIIRGRIAGSLVKLKGNYIYFIYYVSFNIQIGFSQLGDSCSNVIHGASVKLHDL